MGRGPDSVSIVVEEEKRRESIHSCRFSLARCHARWRSHAFRKGKNGPQLPFLASWGVPTPASFEAQSWGTCPPGWRLFLALFFEDATLPKAVHPLVPCLRASKELIHWFNAVTFLRLALRQTTRTLFSSQGTEESIPH
jgi:hypothetical protein